MLSLSRDISVGTAMGYGLDRRGSIADRGKISFFSITFRPAPEAHPAGGSFPRGKVAEAWNWPVTSI
jgi:hypothetical protein